MCTVQDSNIESCEECRKPIKAQQQHESATTTEPKHSIHTVQLLVKLYVAVFIRRIIIVLIVSFTAEMLLCTVEVQSQLL
jgi:hypothetical protein